jgi:hypothetical protein
MATFQPRASAAAPSGSPAERRSRRRALRCRSRRRGSRARARSLAEDPSSGTCSTICDSQLRLTPHPFSYPTSVSSSCSIARHGACLREVLELRPVVVWNLDRHGHFDRGLDRETPTGLQPFAGCPPAPIAVVIAPPALKSLGLPAGNRQGARRPGSASDIRVRRIALRAALVVAELFGQEPPLRSIPPSALLAAARICSSGLPGPGLGVSRRQAAEGVEHAGRPGKEFSPGRGFSE